MGAGLSIGRRGKERQLRQSLRNLAVKNTGSSGPPFEAENREVYINAGGELSWGPEQPCVL